MSTQLDHPAEAIDFVDARLTEAGVLARPLREVLALLAEGSPPLDELVRRSAVPRRTVEELLSAAGADVEPDRGGYRLAVSVRDRYRERFALEELRLPPPPRDERTLERIRSFVETGPSPTSALDHVTATPDTALRRAEWLRDNYDLRHARLLCLGDHDLTSLAVSLVEPSVSVTVLDIDERILAHIDAAAAEHHLGVRTMLCDVRFGLPPLVESWADLVFTDPPYTPEGIGLFATRAAECVADTSSRVLIAYGFSNRSPALGHKVQQELLRLGLVFEAILPDFHRYIGAQAIGSASDLYVCQPTTHTRKLAMRETAGIYTHGPQSVESAEKEVTGEFAQRLAEIAEAPVAPLRQPGWNRPLHDRGVPVFDLRADPGPWLLRMLLACNAQRAAFLVANRHPDTTSEQAQRALTELVSSKYTLRFHRSSPDSQHGVVVATAAADLSATHRLLHRAHGKVGNTWREAVISAAAETGATLTKRQAAERIAASAPYAGDLDLRLIDLPRHRLTALITAASQL